VETIFSAESGIVFFLLLNVFCFFVDRRAGFYPLLWIPLILILSSLIFLMGYIIFGPSKPRPPGGGGGEFAVLLLTLPCIPLILIHLCRYPLGMGRRIEEKRLRIKENPKSVLNVISFLVLSAAFIFVIIRIIKISSILSE
jgi:hypothetical protein